MEKEVINVFESANWILASLCIYIILIIFLGFKYAGKIEESDDLALAGRGLSLKFLIPSILATWICAGAMMGAAAEAYIGGFQAVIFDPFAPVLMLILVGIFFAHKLRKSGYTTIVDFFNDRYGKKMGAIYMAIQILAAMGMIGGQLVALGVIVYLTTGFSLSMAIIIGAIVMIIVTYCGGLWALSRVDALALILIILGYFVIIPPVLEAVGGWNYLIANADNWLELPSFAITPVSAERGGYLWYTGFFGISLYLAAWASLGLGDIPSQVILQRVLAAKDEKVATKGFIISGILYLLLGLIPVMIGIAMYTWGLELPLDKTEMVLPWVADNFLPSWAATLFVVSVAATIISTVGNTTLICSTMVGHNLYKYFKPNATPKEVLKVLRLSLPIITLIALTIALYFETIYKLIVFSGSLQLCTIFAPFIFGFFWKKANTKGAFGAVISGIVSWIIFFILVFPYTKEANFEEAIIEAGLAMDWAIWDGLYISMIPAAIVSISVMIVVSLATQKSNPPLTIINVNGEKMEGNFFFWDKEKSSQKTI